LGTFVLVTTHAATPYVSAEPENGTVSSPAGKVTDATASGGSAVQFSAATSGTTLLGWQVTPQNIGLAPFGLTCSSLPELSADTWPGHTVPAGTTISRKRLTGWYDLSQGNITISQSCIQPLPGYVGIGTESLTTWNTNRPLQGPVTIKDSEFDGSLLSDHDAAWIGFMIGAMSIYRTYVHHSGSGFNTYGSYEKTGADIVLENNFVNDLVAYGDPNNGGNHESAYTARDLDISTNANRQLIVRNNHFVGDGKNMSGTLFLQPNDTDVNNMTISGNLNEGTDGYQLYIDQDPSRFGGSTYKNLKIVNNRMTNGGFGAVFVRDGVPAFAQWQDNYIYNAAAIDGKGALIANPN
jgi:hypothetical protein